MFRCRFESDSNENIMDESDEDYGSKQIIPIFGRKKNQSIVSYKENEAEHMI